VCACFWPHGRKLNVELLAWQSEEVTLIHGGGR